MSRECVTCRFIDNCKTVSPAKILAHFVCDNFQEVESREQIKARCDVINKFGESALRALISPEGDYVDPDKKEA